MNLKNLQLLAHNCDNLVTLKQIHGLAATLGLCDHQPLACEILNLYAKLGRPQEAQKVFNHIHNPDIVSWTCLINLFLRTEFPVTSLSVFSRMLHSGLRPDSFSIVSALSACGRSGNLLSGRVVHGMVCRFDLGIEPVVGNALIDMYSRNGEIEVAKAVFSCMTVTDVSSWTSLLNGFIMCGDLESAHHLFDAMPHRNEVSWTAMISGCVGRGSLVRGLEIFRRMVAEGIDRPTAITVVAVLSASADTGSLDLGRSIHGYVIKGSLSNNVTVNNGLLDMYSKSGSLDVAMNLFSEMISRDAFSWTTMVSACAFHGEGRNALEIFHDMLQSGTHPNEVTFLSVLSACSHAGLVLEGWEIFRRMKNVHKLEPKIGHYGCIVDLLGRAGLLEEAVKFIEQMPLDPDGVIWRSLLTACIFHGNLDLARAVGKKLLELEPDNDGVNVLLWKMCCASNNWEDAMKMRKIMRAQRVKKKPGCSWVEINGIIHKFLAEDRLQYVTNGADMAVEAISETLKLHTSYLYSE